MSKTFKVRCDQCDAIAINGQASHELGCPNRSKPWGLNGETGRWEPMSASELPSDYDDDFYNDCEASNE